MPLSIISKLPGTGTSVFAVMSALARKHNAINLSQGFPGFEVDRALIDRIHHYMILGKNQYAPMPGVPVLREAIAEKIRRGYGKSINPDTEITITAGATQALFTVISAFVSEGDEVIIIEPAYDSYAPAVRLNGGIPVFISLEYPDFRIDWNLVAGSITPRTTMFILNTPNNPGGFVFGNEDMENLKDITSGTNIIVLSDEVYEHILFDGLSHESVLKYDELYERSVAVYSFGKTFHATGWKTGYTIAPGYLTSEIRKVHQFNVFAVNTPVQYALADYLKDPAHYEHVPGFYQSMRDRFISYLSAGRFNVIPTRGTYFQLLDYSRISGQDEWSFARYLTEHHGVASIPVAAFYHDNRSQRILRFCFAKNDDELQKAAERLNAL